MNPELGFGGNRKRDADGSDTDAVSKAIFASSGLIDGISKFSTRVSEREMAWWWPGDSLLKREFPTICTPTLADRGRDMVGMWTRRASRSALCTLHASLTCGEAGKKLVTEGVRTPSSGRGRKIYQPERRRREKGAALGCGENIGTTLDQRLRQIVHMDSHIPLERDACALPVLPQTSSYKPPMDQSGSIRTRIVGLEVLQARRGTFRIRRHCANIRNRARDCVRTCHPQGLIGSG